MGKFVGFGREIYSVADLQRLRMEKAVSVTSLSKKPIAGIVWMLGEQGYFKTHVLSGLTANMACRIARERCSPGAVQSKLEWDTSIYGNHPVAIVRRWQQNGKWPQINPQVVGGGNSCS